MAGQREPDNLWTQGVVFPNTHIFWVCLRYWNVWSFELEYFFFSFKTGWAWGLVASQDKRECQTLGFFFQNRIPVFQPPLRKWVKLITSSSFICMSFLISYHVILLDNIYAWADPSSSWLVVNCVFKQINILQLLSTNVVYDAAVWVIPKLPFSTPWSLTSGGKFSLACPLGWSLF